MDNSTPTVYIVLPIYNGEIYILEQLMSLYYQTYTNRKLYIVNDCCIDSSLEIIHKRINHYSLNDKVTILHNEKNIGVNKTVEHGLTVVKEVCNVDCDLIAYCDADDIWCRNKLEQQVHYMHNNPDFDLSYHDLCLINQNNVLLSHSYQEKLYSIHNNIFDNSFQEFAIGGQHLTSTAMMFRAKDITLLLPFSIFLYQDYRTILVFSLLHKKIGYIKYIGGYYRRHTASLTHSSNNIESHIIASRTFKNLSLALEDLYILHEKREIKNFIDYNMLRSNLYANKTGFLGQLYTILFRFPKIFLTLIKRAFYYYVMKYSV